MKRIVAVVVFIAAASYAKPVEDLLKSGTAEEQGLALMQELGARNAGYKDLNGAVEMVLTDADGSEAKRAFTLKVLEHASAADGDRSIIVFESPSDVKGTTVLSHAGVEAEDEQWLYLPSARRTKRISSSNRTGAFVGSEFTFEDLTGNDPRKYRWKLNGRRDCGEAKCLELEAVPKDASSAYSKRLVLLDATDLRVRRIDFFDRKGEALKTLAYDDYATMNERWLRSQRWTMKNLQTGKSTAIHFTAMKLSTGLTASDFSTGKLGN